MTRLDGMLVTEGPVLIIGAGLLGTSIALRLREHGVRVHIQDASPVAAGLAHDLGAGSLESIDDPALVIIAIPPDVTVAEVKRALCMYPRAVVTDVASVKGDIADALVGNPNRSRWVGSHPMAGKERSGAIAADGDLFVGRPWVIVSDGHTEPEALRMVRGLAIDMGSAPIELEAHAHDHAVAVISHMPQMMSSLVASALVDENAQTLALAGQGLRDVTRIAQSDPLLWASIVSGNRKEIASILRKINAKLGRLVAAIDSPGGLDVITHLMADGNRGVSLIPGKHGGAPARYAHVTVLVPDSAGELGRLFSDIGDAGINIEDFTLEHSAQQAVGRAEISVIPGQAQRLEHELGKREWQVVSTEQESEPTMIIAIDGPSGSGKSTVSKHVARRLGLAYLDTGAMYRAATWWALHQGIELNDADAVLAAVREMPLEIRTDPDDQHFVIGGDDITEAIRTSDISRVVSQVATNLEVRHEMVRRQQAVIANETLEGSFSEGRGIVAEGRDITTVVAPDADVRVLLTASEDARLRRRSLEVRGDDDEATLAATRDEVVRRDQDDSTVADFMCAQDGVTTIDSSELTIDEVVDAVIALTR